MPPVSKTCQSCADSKVRCVRNPNAAGACNRCLRLGRECLYRQAGRRFNGFQKDRKIEALESKITELMADRSALSEENELNSNAPGAKVIDDRIPVEDIIRRGFLTIEKAESYLDTFKTRMTPNFPFVVVAPSISITRLHQEKPFLSLAILASAAYDNMPLQRVVEEEIKKCIASRMLINGEVSFDLLQGLLVFLAWSHYYSRPHRYTQFLQLAIGLVVDLRLDRPPRTRVWKTGLRFGQRYNLNEQLLDRPYWGSDDQRALLGCYYLSSSIAVLVQKHSTFAHLPYLEECCRSLSHVKEYQHDKYISHIIRLQFIAENIDSFSAKHRIELEHPGSGSELYIANLKSELEGFCHQLPFDLNESPLLATQYHATGLSLYQVSLTIANRHSQSNLVASHCWQDEISLAAKVSANAILAQYILLPLGQELGFNNTQWVQMAFALLFSYRHAVINSNPEQKAALLHTLSQVRSRVGALSTAHVDVNGARDVFFDFRRRVLRIESWLGIDGKDEASSAGDEGLDIFEDFSSTSNPKASHFESSMEDMGDLGVPPRDFFSPFVDDWQGFPGDFFSSSFGGVGDWE
ncbi:hypothetical protein N7508_009775 [Penicillium antarcticum]|uniref:uncharacterized protein n=1 Tax=Penicillium antarcticum TaxID=416450 RepID=UPI0023A531D5|nr:uncharacterized protein N7508_009775 [Penicillium antarcticum]KAJ5294954.1 hypothetical protein N7508_009775 [Penicillium antarcticum]